MIVIIFSCDSFLLSFFFYFIKSSLEGEQFTQSTLRKLMIFSVLSHEKNVLVWITRIFTRNFKFLYIINLFFFVTGVDMDMPKCWSSLKYSIMRFYAKNELLSSKFGPQDFTQYKKQHIFIFTQKQKEQTVLVKKRVRKMFLVLIIFSLIKFLFVQLCDFYRLH